MLSSLISILIFFLPPPPHLGHICFSNSLLTVIPSENVLMIYIYSHRCLYSNNVCFSLIQIIHRALEKIWRREGENKPTYSPNTQRP